MASELIKKESVEKATKIQEIQNNYNICNADSKGAFYSASKVATGMALVRRELDNETMKPFMEIMNSPLGFLTDCTGKPQKNGRPSKEPYGVEVVRDCLIEAIIKGVDPVGNQFNILGGRCYITREGYTNLIRKHPQINEYKDTVKVIANDGEMATVDCRAKWKDASGKEESFSKTIYTKSNKYIGFEALQGKALRKLRAAVYELISGMPSSDGEVEAVNVEFQDSKPDKPSILDAKPITE
jgi:hypothetical protein